MQRTSRRGPPGSALAALLAPLALSGCATLTGVVTGPFTGAVDLPAELSRRNEPTLKRRPAFYAHWLVTWPIGVALGAPAGLIKGAAVDAAWFAGRADYGRAFGSYQEQSIWRPYSWVWKTE